ncbi:major facilitator superfamily domain-containing protein [Pseudomassariella vexata]|uniref:Major facilitator superfamily domain-containing protein n=1 Tax=Pseudomassariella vexata TaxID=1141098 RepID=A0A1Y2EHJ4_9PEZI|nr:major facilitator superfamily domain-containing protein [Pseudomassariella vexata]ORY71033.1 major facilitator superfamily domain-containing protein [Pseudomassariella vexata]
MSRDGVYSPRRLSPLLQDDLVPNSRRTSKWRMASAIAWIGTVQGFLLNLVGFISGPIYDMGHIKPLIYGGGLLNVLGLVATSFASQYAWAFLSLGVCVGLGSGLLYVPSVAIVATYFTTKRPLATGISATGSSIGGVLYPVLFRVLVDRVGFSWACRSFAFINGGLLITCCLLIAPRVVPFSKRRIFATGALRDFPFLLFSTALFLLWLGVDVPFFFLPSFIQERLNSSAELGDYLLSAMSASSLFGRVLLGLVASNITPLGVWQASIGASCVLLFCWATIGNLPGIVAFVIFYGFFTGGVISLVSPVLLVISPDLSIVGSRLGMSSIFSGLGFLVGPPISGAIQKGAVGYCGQSAFAGSTYLVAFAIVVVVGWRHRRSTSRDEHHNDGNTQSVDVPKITVVVLRKERKS